MGTGQAGALIDLVGDLVGVLDIGELRQQLLETLLRAIPAKWASLNEVGPDRVVALVVPHLDEVWTRRFAALAHENPLYQYWQQTHDGRANRFSDVTTRAELEATSLYREIYAPLGIRYQMAFSLPNEPDRILAVVLHREDREFSDAERDFLNRARPFLIQIYRNAIAYTEARAASDGKMAAALVDHGLTAREAEVLELVAHGASNRDAGSRLGVSQRTVQKHLEHAFRKLGATSRSDAASRAWRLVGEARPTPN
jgi:DNA-binding CsgD family transcriptional regulator